MGQGGECESGIIYWPGKHNPGQSRNGISWCVSERAGNRKGEVMAERGLALGDQDDFCSKEGNILQGEHLNRQGSKGKRCSRGFSSP